MSRKHPLSEGIKRTAPSTGLRAVVPPSAWCQTHRALFSAGWRLLNILICRSVIVARPLLQCAKDSRHGTASEECVFEEHGRKARPHVTVYAESMVVYRPARLLRFASKVWRVCTGAPKFATGGKPTADTRHRPQSPEQLCPVQSILGIDVESANKKPRIEPLYW